MNKRVWLCVFPFLIAFLILSGCLGNSSDDKEKVVDIQRSFSTAGGEAAIQAAEELDYETLLNLPRYEPRHNDPNFIDSAVIEKYSDQDGDLTYSADCEYYPKSTLVFKDKNDQLEITANGTKVTTASAANLGIDELNVAIINNGSITRMPAKNFTMSTNSTLTLEKFYIIEMEFVYGKSNDGFGYGHDIYQFVVLDESLDPVIIVHLTTQTWQSDGMG